MREQTDPAVLRKKCSEKINKYSYFQITWLKNGKIVDVMNSNGIVVIFKGSLALIKISSVLPEDSGEYTLIAENYYGRVRFLLGK